MLSKSISSTVFFCLVAMACWAQGNTFPASGNVGIGTTAPASHLEIRGRLTINENGHARIYTGVSSEDLNRYLLLLNSPIAASASGLKAGGILVSDSYAYANPGKNDLIVKGNVGIGTITPQERLSVNGNIRAREVKVETANWPDYVFTEGYELMPLAELESHIKTHGHLPGIPTAKEAEADGIGLAEMNRKLLEKVEELTLHIISQSKDKESLQAQMSVLQDEISQIKHSINQKNKSI